MGAQLRDHVIVVGYGLNGRNVARTLSAAHISYVVLEMAPETVRDQRRKCTPINYGDASQGAVLYHTHVHTAHVLVVSISDAAATPRVVGLAHWFNPGGYIIARTRYSQEVDPVAALRE